MSPPPTANVPPTKPTRTPPAGKARRERRSGSPCSSNVVGIATTKTASAKSSRPRRSTKTALSIRSATTAAKKRAEGIALRRTRMLPAGRPGPSGHRSGHRRCRWRPVQPHLYPLPRLPPGRTGGRGPGSGRSRRQHRSPSRRCRQRLRRRVGRRWSADPRGGVWHVSSGRTRCTLAPRGHTDRHDRRFSR